MARIISIINQKGGTGKTTTAMNLGVYLAAFGKKTLLVDLDSQGNATSGLGVDTRIVAEDIYSVVINEVSPFLAIHNTNLRGFDILPASRDLAGAEVELINVSEREFRLKKVFEKIKSEYDFILIDSPPSLGLLTINSLCAADELLIPMQCEYYALEGLSQLFSTIDLVRENLGANPKILGAVLTMFDRKSRLSRAVSKEIKNNFPGYVFEAMIPRNISLAEAPSFGKSIFRYDPYSHGAKAYRQLAEEVIKMV
ncbi:MAG: ParA family protein [Parcubacteria group bacterium]|nr:ParA family protein [Parcubacteria group bacterium]